MVSEGDPFVGLISRTSACTLQPSSVPSRSAGVSAVGVILSTKVIAKFLTGSLISLLVTCTSFLYSFSKAVTGTV